MRKIVATGLGAMLLAFVVCCLYWYIWREKTSTNHVSGASDLVLASPAELKRHALETFAQYTSSGNPQWESWADKCEVHLMDNCAQIDDPKKETTLFHVLHGLQIPPQLAEESNHGDLRLHSQDVYYNEAAAASILNHHLYSKAILDDRLNALLQNRVAMADLSVSDFDSGSVIVKVFWQSILPVGPHYPWCSPSPTGYSPISIFNSTIIKPIDGKLPAQPWIVPCNYIDTTRPYECEQKAFGDGHIYTLGCFLFREVSSDDNHILRPEMRSPLYDKNNGLCSKQKCYLILMAVHIMTRETPNWVWMTYWWTNEHKSSSIVNKWAFFDANVSINTMDPIFSPYIEGIRNGVNSNCIRCHRFAAYNPSVDSSFGQKGYDTPPPFAGDLQYPPCYFGKMLRTHFLWTVATHQDDSISQSSNPCPETTRH